RAHLRRPRRERIWPGACSGAGISRHFVVVSVAEQVYSYLSPSAVESADGRLDVALSTSGGRAAHPHFFSGFLGRPRQTAQGLLAVAEVARTRYFEPSGMVRARILAADPVVTSNGDRLRFE